MKISKRQLNAALDRFLNEPEYLQHLMQSIEDAGINDEAFLGFKRGTYQAFKKRPYKGAIMCLLAGFALGYEVKRLEDSGIRAEVDQLHRAQACWKPKGIAGEAKGGSAL
jgi:hypothetical protein